jgi:predicted transcriptional regulator
VSKPENILISMHETHASNFRVGKKTVELRRRTIHLSPGTLVWIYTKVPKGSVELLGTVDEVIRDSPKNLWRRFGAKSAISKGQFDLYFEDALQGSAIILREIKQLSPTVKLDRMRRISTGFNPPQFFKKLGEESPELKLLRSSRLKRTVTR